MNFVYLARSLRFHDIQASKRSQNIMANLTCPLFEGHA